MATVATSTGIILGALTIGGIGAWSGNEWTGAVTGVLIGGLVGYGVAAGRMGWGVAGVIFAAVLAVLIGPSVDDYGGTMGFWVGVVGTLAVLYVRAIQPDQPAKKVTPEL